AACAAYKMPAMALLDSDGVYGAARFHLAAEKAGIKAHIGAEISVKLPQLRKQDTAPSVVNIPLLVRSRTGYQNLCRLITLMKLRVPKHAKPGECAVTPSELASRTEGLICLTGSKDGPMAGSFADLEKMENVAGWLIDLFGKGNVYAELQRHFNREEEWRNQSVIELARRQSLPLL